VEAFTAEVIEENAGASQKREARNSGS